MKKLLLLIIAFVVIVAGLIIGIAVRVVTKTKLCVTPECVVVASDMIQSIKKDENPCENFYEYVCGNYIKNAKVQNESSVKEKWVKTAKQQFNDLFSEAHHANDSIAHKNLKYFYEACMDEPEIERNGLEYVEEILGQFRESFANKSSNVDWISATVKLRELGLYYESIFEFSMLRLPGEPAYFSVTHSSKYIPKNISDCRKIIGHIANVFEAFGARDGLVVAMEIFDVLVELNNIHEKNVNLTSKNSTFMTLGELQLLHPQINHSKLLNGIFHPAQLKEDDVIDFQVNSTIAELFDLIARTPERVLANLMLWEVIVHFRVWLPQEVSTNITQTFRRTNDRTRQEDCIFHITHAYPYVANLLYAMRHTSDHTLSIVAEVFAKVKSKYRQTLLNKFKWMDKDTKVLALQKLDSMTYYVCGRSGVSLKDLPYHQINYAESKDYIAAIARATSESYTFKYSQIKWSELKEERVQNILHSASVNAFYRTTNQIILTPAILQNVVYSDGFPRYLQYARLGYLIAHEMTHAFHSLLSWTALDDSLESWWSDETEMGFKNATRCLVKSYEDYAEATFNRTLNGTHTLEENFCDSVGQYIAYEVLRDLPKSYWRLPGLEGYTPNQLYWLQNVYLYCDPSEEEREKLSLHAIPSFRSQFPIAQFDYFADDFDCPIGAHMNPAEKCRVF